MQPVIVYASLGRDLHVFAADGQGFRCLQTVLLPRKVQYGWPTRDRRLLYLASSGPVGASGRRLHVHPSGRFLYVGIRAKDMVDLGGQQVFTGGVNDVAVFALDAADGTPRLIGRADTGGIFPRTMGISECGRWLVVGNEMPRLVRDGDGIRQVWPGLVLFAIGEGDGQLTPVARPDFPGIDDVCFWVDSFAPLQG